MSEFGPRVEFYDVEQAVLGTLQTWLDTFLNNVELRSGYWSGSRPVKRPEASGWEVVSAHHDVPGQTFPQIAVESAGMAEGPEVAADGVVNGAWLLTVQVVVKGRSRDVSRRTLSAFEAAVRSVLFAHGDHDGFAVGTVLGASRYDLIPVSRDRTLVGAEIPVTVFVDAVNRVGGGPGLPDDPAPTPAPVTEPTDPAHLSTHVVVGPLD